MGEAGQLNMMQFMKSLKVSKIVYILCWYIYMCSKSSNIYLGTNSVWAEREENGQGDKIGISCVGKSFISEE